MRSRSSYAIKYAPAVYDHIDSIEPKHYRLIERTIQEQLGFTPLVQTRNRKPLDEPNALEAAWELRFGPGNTFRVFYAVDQATHVVTILAIGVKYGRRLLIGGEEFQL